MNNDCASSGAESRKPRGELPSESTKPLVTWGEVVACVQSPARKTRLHAGHG